MTYYIIPREEIAMELNANNADEAMETFAIKMDLNMNTYFRAVTEDEYAAIAKEKRWAARCASQIDFYISELEDNDEFDEISEDDIREVAENAYEIYCNAGSYPYCDIATEYDALYRAYEEYQKENGKEDE